MREQRLLLRALLTVAAVRAVLWVVPFRHIRARLLSSRRAGAGSYLSSFDARQLSHAVRAAGRLVPNATCLTQAIALFLLFERAGRPSRIHIGVAKENGRFIAHAWVEYDGEIVIGEGEHERYTPLLELHHDDPLQ
jgi:hypothetical protein